MFQSLRTSSPLYILYKSDPKIAIGEVISVGSPMPPQYPTTTYQAGMVMPQKMFVDVKVQIGNEVLDLQKLPADAMIADFGSAGMVVSESRDAIVSEIDGMKKLSKRALDEVDKHRHILEECDKMLADINPQLKKEAEQSAEIENIKKSMADLQDSLVDMKAMLSKALNRSPKKDE